MRSDGSVSGIRTPRNHVDLAGLRGSLDAATDRPRSHLRALTSLRQLCRLSARPCVSFGRDTRSAVFRGSSRPTIWPPAVSWGTGVSRDVLSAYSPAALPGLILCIVAAASVMLLRSTSDCRPIAPKTNGSASRIFENDDRGSGDSPW